MDPTTLVTFLFKAPPEVRTVELLGSWDNFTRPYYMHHDKRRGRGFWAGCFHFRDIIFDGDRADWTRPRSGGLKQGGTYWYFYRLNDAIEAFDDARDFTCECPLLPGQTVNVIDVPVEVEELPTRRRSAMVDFLGDLVELRRTQHTWNPKDRRAALEPPPVSKVHERCISDLALNGRLETKPHSFRDAPSPPVSPVSGTSRNRLAVPGQCAADDARSLVSRTGWSSAPPSRGDSSIFDAFIDHGHGADDASISAFPLPDAYSSDQRPITRDGGSAHRGFDFAFDSNSTRHNRSRRTGDDDLDGSSFIYEPADSPPRSAYGSVDWRFTVPPVEQATDDHPHDNSQHPPPSRSPPHPPRHSSESSTSHPDMEPSPDAFELGSPTFSAATISSEGGGLNTPFRLSFPNNQLHPSPSRSLSNTQDDNAADEINDITARLRHLGSEDSAATLSSRADTDVEDETPPSRGRPAQPQRREYVAHYALPVQHHDLDARSTTTLGKVSSGHGSLATMQQGQEAWEVDVPPLPTTTGGLLHVGEGASFADDIFDELGYLGGSIA